MLWLSKKGRTDDYELFSDNSYLSAIHDRQGLPVAVPVDHRTENSECFSPKLLLGFWSKLKDQNSKIVVMYPTVTSKKLQSKGSHLATILLVLGRSRISNLWW